MPIAIMFISATSIRLGETSDHHFERMRQLGPPFLEISKHTSDILQSKMMEFDMQGTKDFFIINLTYQGEEYFKDTIDDREVHQFINEIKRYRVGLGYDIGVWVIYNTFTKKDVCEAYDIPI